MDPFQKYKSASMSTDDSVKRLLFVLDEVLKLLYVAQKALGEKDYESKYKTLSKVTDVFYILRSGVDLENGGDAIKMLDNFYASAIHNLQQANIKAESPEELDSIIKAVSIVKDTIKSELDKVGSRS